MNQSSVCFDTETTGIDALNAELVGMSFSFEKGKAFYVPFPENQEEAQVLADKFKPFFESEIIEKIGQNIKYDLKILSHYGVQIKGKWNMQGSVSCIVHLQEDDQVLTSNATIIVDTASGAALLEFNGHGGHLLQYNESQLMHLACRAQYGTFSRAKLLIGKQFMEFLTVIELITSFVCR